MSTFALLDQYATLRRELSLMFAGELKDASLGHQQMRVLYHLLEANLSMSELSAFTQADPASTSRTVKGLEKSGMLKRIADDQDARKSIIQLTAKGRAQAAEALTARNKIGELLNETLSESDRKTLIKLLDKVNASLKEKRKA